ncbi:PAAR domain-containing protein [Pseudomonas sp. Fl4BN1]|uniref:PAAR domain-containing protein n=1 Tax=Pseudomonas sp. Fl4BN1 TaxID=2697651 RepID=UPI0013767233|nr:PAAR domain-containing protein [Pseudomonas sp. Fl4BN1]NBF11540.1 hypothetical protein [Pseudomonas sp. Fl4BN1]
MDALSAARLGDEIAHGFGVAAMVAGAVAGALIGAAIIGATAVTGGLAAVVLAGSVAAGGLSMFQIVKGLSTIFNLPEPGTGVLVEGSVNVFINGRNAMRAGADMSSSCSGLPFNHPYLPMPVLIAEGSAKVTINGKPAARLQSKMVCGAHIKSGSENTLIGGPSVQVAFVFDLDSWMHTGLEVLGLGALLGAGVLAAFTGLAVFAGFAAVTGAAFVGMGLLGDLGDRLGPGYRDLLQGAAGMALLGLGPKMAGAGKRPPPPEATVYHVTTNPGAAQGVLSGIDPKFLNPNSRFGAAFYVGESPTTPLAELAHHGATPTHGIRFNVNASKAKVLDLTDPAVAKEWGYNGGPISAKTQQIGVDAGDQGYNVIRFGSERDPGGVNHAVLDNFNEILTPQMITPVEP